MTRRKTLHAAALSLFVFVTVPGFALLCRGHSPSRFASSNLPFWERTLPRPARLRVSLRCRPAPPGSFQLTDTRLLRRLTYTNPNDLFLTLEHPSKRQPSPTGAGRPGLWLLTACALGRSDGALRQEQDAVANRLMNAQDNDGYLAAGTGADRWKPAQSKAFAQNLRGLLAYYAASHNPASIYAAMQAGDLIVTEFSSLGSESPAASPLVLPMAQLYEATCEPRYLHWAVAQADMENTDGLGLCAVYQATDDRSYLETAQTIWKMECAAKKPDADLAAALWTLTGAPGCLATLRTEPSPWLCPIAPGSLAFAHIPGGIAVNTAVNAHATFGAVRLTQRIAPDPHHTKLTVTTITVQAPHPIAFALRIAPPASPKPQSLSVSLNGTLQTPAACDGQYITLKRRWKAGDTVQLTSAIN